MRFGPVRPLVRSTAIAGLSDEVITALRERVVTGYYDQPQVVASLARIITDGMRGVAAGRGARGTPLPG